MTVCTLDPEVAGETGADYAQSEVFNHSLGGALSSRPTYEYYRKRTARGSLWQRVVAELPCRSAQLLFGDRYGWRTSKYHIPHLPLDFDNHIMCIPP